MHTFEHVLTLMSLNTFLVLKPFYFIRNFYTILLKFDLHSLDILGL